MANNIECIYLLNDCITLPITISDWDAPNTQIHSSPETAEREIAQANKHQASASTYSQFSWKTGFSDYVDDLWKAMTEEMKRKLREACVEVLRRTDEAGDERIFEQVDDDARLLD